MSDRIGMEKNDEIVPKYLNNNIPTHGMNLNIFDVFSDFMEKNDIVNILNLRGEKQEKLFQEAQKVRNKYLGNTVSVRGVIEVSNLCNVNCEYCAMRTSNKEIERYVMPGDEIFEIAKQINDAGIQTLFIQSGEDRTVDSNIREAIRKIKNSLGGIKNIILNCGNRTKQEYEVFKNAGADGYILKFETSNYDDFKNMRHNSLDKRLQCIDDIKAAGLRIGTGNITGLPGQNLGDMAQDILFSYNIHPDFISTAPFIPNEGTPLEKGESGSVDLALNTIALLRIILKDVSIPTVSAFEKLRKGGQKLGFNAGANVITANFTPKKEQRKYNIYSSGRFVVSLEHALKTIEEAGLESDIERPT